MREYSKITYQSYLYKYRIKGILFSILSLSGLLSGEPDRVSHMMVLIKTVSKTPDKDSIENKQPFILFIGNLHTKIIKTEKRFFCRYRKDFGSKLFLFPCKNYSFWGLLFSVFWFVKRHSFKPHMLHFQLNYECDITGRNFHRSSNLCIFRG